MAKPRKDQFEETKRVMERLVNTPHKLHEDSVFGWNARDRASDG